MYKHRYLEETILKLNKSFKALYVSGPRQAGKTTLLTHLAKKFGVNCISLDDLTVRRLAQEDPELFLERFERPLLIDEVQYAPQLFPYIKMAIDASDKNGQYWLTGSQQFSIMKNVKESLAGRIGIVNLLGFSLAEDMMMPAAKAPFLPRSKPTPGKAVGINKLFNVILRGSFPLLTHKNPPPLEVFYNSYLQTYIDRDLREIFHISKISLFHRFLQLCAARTGQMLNYSDLARDAGVSVHAAKEWIGILEASFQIYLLQPYYKNLSKRVIKAPKLYFLDTGLAAYLTRWKTAETLASGAMSGAFFETFIISEIIKSYWFRGMNAPIYYFRDKEGHEIDLLIENEGSLHPMEIKLSSNIKDSVMKNLFYFRNKYPASGNGGIICTASRNLPIDKINAIYPFTSIT